MPGGELFLFSVPIDNLDADTCLVLRKCVANVKLVGVINTVENKNVKRKLLDKRLKQIKLHLFKNKCRGVGMGMI